MRIDGLERAQEKITHRAKRAPIRPQSWEIIDKVIPYNEATVGYSILDAPIFLEYTLAPHRLANIRR